MRGRIELFWVVSLCAAASSGACASSPAAPTPASPASPQAEEAPAREVATSLTRDPLLTAAPADVSGHAHHHHHGTGQVAAPAPDAGPAPPAPAPPPAADGGTPPQAAEYTCPMHPDVREPKPGRCPRCGMALVPLSPTPHSQEGHEHAH